MLNKEKSINNSLIINNLLYKFCVFKVNLLEYIKIAVQDLTTEFTSNFKNYLQNYLTIEKIKFSIIIILLCSTMFFYL